RGFPSLSSCPWVELYLAFWTYCVYLPICVFPAVQIPLLQLEPTARDTSESTGRVLRPNAHLELRKVTREEFAAQLKDITDASFFLPAVNECNRAPPAQPEYSFLVSVNEHLPSPVTPSSKDSKDESFDDFTSIDNPQANFPGTYQSTPKSEQKKRVEELSIETINKPSDLKHIASSATTLTTPIKQEEIYPKLPEAAPIIPQPPSIPSHNPAQAYAHQPTNHTCKPSNPRKLPLTPNLFQQSPHRNPLPCLRPHIACQYAARIACPNSTEKPRSYATS
ncbi:hypothetical protein CY34DRAFT_18559, partial [Suillus luteus UH-Slu-Lm8-n1]